MLYKLQQLRVRDHRMNLYAKAIIYLIQLFGNLLYILCRLERVSDVRFLPFQSSPVKLAKPGVFLCLGSGW